MWSTTSWSNFLKVNKKLADRYGLECWTNSETFDRDMPIKFLPIKWEKLRLKMGLAAQAGYRNAITFEFSHFMSPQSAYLQAGHLYDRYMEYLKTWSRDPMNGHNLKPGGFAAALAVLIAVVLASCSPKGAAGGDAACGLSDADFRTEGILEAIPVRATFLDEVSWDIPHQNWGVREWDADFRAMKNMGINTVVLIRAGLGRWIAAPFECLLESEEVYYPPVDLVEMFLTLADKYGMAFYFGMYDSGKYWQEGLFRREIRPEPETDRRGVGQIRPPQVVSGVVSLAGDQPPDQKHVAHLCGSGPPCQGGFGRPENDDFALHPRRQDRSGDGGRQGPFGRRAPPRVERDTGQCRRSGGHPCVSRTGRSITTSCTIIWW